MKWSGVFIKLQKVPQNNVNLNHLFGQKWQLFLWDFMMFQATFQEQDFFFRQGNVLEEHKMSWILMRDESAFLKEIGGYSVHATLFVNNFLIQHFSEM